MVITMQTEGVKAVGLAALISGSVLIFLALSIKVVKMQFLLLALALIFYLVSIVSCKFLLLIKEEEQSSIY